VSTGRVAAGSTDRERFCHIHATSVAAGRHYDGRVRRRVGDRLGECCGATADDDGHLAVEVGTGGSHALVGAAVAVGDSGLGDGDGRGGELAFVECFPADHPTAAVVDERGSSPLITKWDDQRLSGGCLRPAVDHVHRVAGCDPRWCRLRHETPVSTGRSGSSVVGDVHRERVAEPVSTVWGVERRHCL
jgi:hypothetical protein